MLTNETKNEVKVKLLTAHDGLPMYAALEALAKKFASGDIQLTNDEIRACQKETNER